MTNVLAAVAGIGAAALCCLLLFLGLRAWKTRKVWRLMFAGRCLDCGGGPMVRNIILAAESSEGGFLFGCFACGHSFRIDDRGTVERGPKR